MKKKVVLFAAVFALFASAACAAVNEAGLPKLEEVMNKYSPEQFVEFAFGPIGTMKTRDDKEIPAVAYGVKYNTDFFLKTFAPEMKAAMDGVFPAPAKYRYKDDPQRRIRDYYAGREFKDIYDHRRDNYTLTDGKYSALVYSLTRDEWNTDPGRKLSGLFDKFFRKFYEVPIEFDIYLLDEKGEELDQVNTEQKHFFFFGYYRWAMAPYLFSNTMRIDAWHGADETATTPWWLPLEGIDAETLAKTKSVRVEVFYPENR
ncbi:MAG: hypothetical protein II965_02820 [Pyramidobacter sp.]|nr:hypothetical protein [Pyramidobacter sp.]